MSSPSGPSNAMAPPGPPYAPQVALLGLTPSVGVDVPICAVLMAFFIGSAASNMTIFQINRRRGHKFILSLLMFGLSMIRIATMATRIAWSAHSDNVRLAIASAILTSAGVVVLYIINLLFTQRIIRATHPRLGWHKAFSILFPVLFALVVVNLIMIITVSIQTYYTLDPNTRRIDQDFQHAVQSYFVFVSFLPIPMVILALQIPRRLRLDKFGAGRWRTKVVILLTTSTLLTLGGSFKLGTSFKSPRPISDPAWYHAKWCYYCFNFVIELLVLYLHILVRVDRRFHVPNGSKQHGDYCGCTPGAGKEKIVDEDDGIGSLRINNEEDLFDDEEYCDCSHSGSIRSGSRGADPEVARPSGVAS